MTRRLERLENRASEQRLRRMSPIYMRSTMDEMRLLERRLRDLIAGRG